MGDSQPQCQSQRTEKENGIALNAWRKQFEWSIVTAATAVHASYRLLYTLLIKASLHCVWHVVRTTQMLCLITVVRPMSHGQRAKSEEKVKTKWAHDTSPSPACCRGRGHHTTTMAIIKSSLDCHKEVISIDANRCGPSTSTFDVAHEWQNVGNYFRLRKIPLPMRNSLIN